MGTYISEEDIEDLTTNMTPKSLKKGCIVCFIVYISARFLLWAIPITTYN